MALESLFKETQDDRYRWMKVVILPGLSEEDKDKGGPTPKDGIALKQFVRTLAELYESATKKPAASGFRHDGMSDESGSEFFKFVETCLAILDYRPQSRAALGMSIERILKTP